MISHVTYTVNDIKKSISFYNKVFNTEPVAVGRNLAYYDIDGTWFALNYEEKAYQESYQHIAFYIESLDEIIKRLEDYEIAFSYGRQRSIDEKPSIYLKDLDGNLLEFHTGLLQDRLNCYKERIDIKVE
jgi:metallothiol transferase